MVPESARLTPEERANLVAYLDHELGPAQAEAIAAKLAASATARHEADAMARAWDLLDALPRPRATAELTSRTLQRAGALEAPETYLEQAAGRAARVVAQVALVLATAAGALGIGYALTRWAWPDPTARLARDLSLAEHLDEYREAGSMEFLRRLDTSTLLDDLP